MPDVFPQLLSNLSTFLLGGGVPKKKLGLVSTTQLKNHESKNGSFPPHFKGQKNPSASWRFFKISASASCGGTCFELEQKIVKDTQLETNLEERRRIHPRKLTWNLKRMVSKRNLLFQGCVFGAVFHENSSKEQTKMEGKH